MEKLCCKPANPCEIQGSGDTRNIIRYIILLCLLRNINSDHTRKYTGPMCDQVRNLFQYLDPSREAREYHSKLKRGWYEQGECGHTGHSGTFSRGRYHVAGIGRAANDPSVFTITEKETSNKHFAPVLVCCGFFLSVR